MNAPTDNLVTLTELSTDMEAAMIIAALEREGIEAFMKGEYTAGFRAEAPSWPKVEVRVSDFERARSVLAALHPQSEDMPSNEEADTRSAWQTICRLLVIAGLIATGFSFVYSVVRALSK
ncbi:MAG: DUF2007 domain-containing protein [Bythopirellula sp.]|nr:DUF2007 domain-containing protein [Bythopirellula sp.]